MAADRVAHSLFMARTRETPFYETSCEPEHVRNGCALAPVISFALSPVAGAPPWCRRWAATILAQPALIRKKWFARPLRVLPHHDTPTRFDLPAPTIKALAKRCTSWVFRFGYGRATDEGKMRSSRRRRRRGCCGNNSIRMATQFLD